MEKEKYEAFPWMMSRGPRFPRHRKDSRAKIRVFISLKFST